MLGFRGERSDDVAQGAQTAVDCERFLCIADEASASGVMQRRVGGVREAYSNEKHGSLHTVWGGRGRKEAGVCDGRLHDADLHRVTGGAGFFDAFAASQVNEVELAWFGGEVDMMRVVVVAVVVEVLVVVMMMMMMVMIMMMMMMMMMTYLSPMLLLTCRTLPCDQIRRRRAHSHHTMTSAAALIHIRSCLRPRRRRRIHEQQRLRK
jgi:hypothetical protein